MTSDGDLLLRAILESPAEDTPRLIYADALDERGNLGDAEAAEFIRVQCRLARPPWYSRDMIREQQLWKAKIHTPLVDLHNTLYFCTPTRKEDHPTVWLQAWRRGFCEEIRYSAECFLEIADYLIWNPKMRDVRGRTSFPRPCPPTAQPIRKVVLSEIRQEDFYPLQIHQPEAGLWLSSKWPGVEFEIEQGALLIS